MMTQTILMVACSILAIGFAIITIKHLLTKRDIRQIKKKLDEIMVTETNAHLTSGTFDRGIVALTESINGLLKKTRQDYLKMIQTEADLKRAITNISHDLRTPLTSANGYLQMIEEEQLDPVSKAHYSEIVRGRLDALTELLDSLFAFSCALEGNMTIESVDISHLLRETLLNNYLDLEGKGFTVESQIPKTPVYHLCDQEALERVIQNLIKNAHVHGKNFLSVKLEDGVIEVANEVNNPDEIDTLAIFQRFYTADAARTNKRTGLGLAIVKELVEKMGGSITAEKVGRMLVVRVHLVSDSLT
jgi:signal transduction histidine kinase